MSDSDISGEVKRRNSSKFDEEVSAIDEICFKELIRRHLPNVEIHRIEKLKNEYLYSAFLLKKAQMQNARVEVLIHSTAAENVKSIEKDNLDWRRVNRAKYGHGVSFSENSDYCNFHSSWSGGNERAFIVCDVLVSNITLVSDNQDKYPRSGDTYLSQNGYVYVKFEDFTYYPKYALYYVKPDPASSQFYRRRRRRFLF